MSQDKVRELWGKKFKVVKEGLDEKQVVDFINELIQQRGTLLEQINSLLSYIRLSKNMVGKQDGPTGSSGQQAEGKADSILTEVRQDTKPELKTTEPEQVTLPVPEATKAGAGKKEPTLYQGEVELAILPPSDATGLIQFQRTLRDSFQLKIVRTDGSPSKGSLITVLLNEPQPLLQGLKQVPKVKEAVEEIDTSAQAKETLPSLFKNNQGRRIWVTLHT